MSVLVFQYDQVRYDDIEMIRNFYYTIRITVLSLTGFNVDIHVGTHCIALSVESSMYLDKTASQRPHNKTECTLFRTNAVLYFAECVEIYM